MTTTLHAIRVGLRRGGTELMLSLKSTQDLSFYILMALIALGYLYLRRDTIVEGTDLSFPTLAMPSLLGSLMVFGLVMGPAGQLAMDREDGTLLRAKAVPGGILGYVMGQIVTMSGSLVPMLLIVLLPGAFLFDDLMPSGGAGWIRLLWVMLLGIVAILPIGIIIGSLVPSLQKVNTWGLFPMMILAGISGIFYPIQALWGWLQGVAQAFPMYWMGLGMRSAFLPDEAASLELQESWQTGQMITVLSIWAILGLVLAPILLRRMARRQSGSSVGAAREQAAQWVR
ncbi:MAG: ABC transporter permease [Demequinaceae bacterium]|nr:ABC transporter permease [Demequinaceae bacterium]